ncbi:MAG: hypothetical protein H0W74_00360 [Sphingosinicella sp.]|nr:hypothetical protein [Sphingosinicella sp.]
MKLSAMIFLSLALSAAADARDAPPQSPLIRALVDCRSQTNDTSRLRCYDLAAGALVEASAQGKIVVLDQEQARTTRRSLFGFHLPKLPLFSGDESAEFDSGELTAKVTSVRAMPNGRWQMKIEGGALWETTEASSVVNDPRAGNTLVIKRGPLGSYMIRIEGQRALRAKRVG